MRSITVGAGIMLLASVSPHVLAQQTDRPPTDPAAEQQLSQLTIPAGENLRVVIAKGFRVKGLNQPVVASISEPVFVGNREVIAPGALVHGHITALSSAGTKARFERLLGGDLTPPKIASVTFDELEVAGAPSCSLATEAAPEMERTKRFLFQSKRDRPRRKAQVRMQVSSLAHAPNKLQKISQGLASALPVHPEFVSEGAVFNAHLSSPLALATAYLPDPQTQTNNESSLLRLRLLTPLDSGRANSSRLIEAVTSTPYYDGHQRLVYPAGALLTGSITRIKAAGWFQKQGQMNFHFTSIATEGEQPTAFDARVVGLDAAKTEDLSIDEEGAIRVTYSPVKRISSALSLLGPSRGLADASLNKTAFQRGGQGRNGVGLIGSGAAQASASAAVGFGYYAAARKIYGAFIAKGGDVRLPTDTTLLVAKNR